MQGRFFLLKSIYFNQVPNSMLYNCYISAISSPESLQRIYLYLHYTHCERKT